MKKLKEIKSLEDLSDKDKKKLIKKIVQGGKNADDIIKEIENNK